MHGSEYNEFQLIAYQDTVFRAKAGTTCIGFSNTRPRLLHAASKQLLYHTMLCTQTKAQQYFGGTTPRHLTCGTMRLQRPR